ncbi:MAG: phospholipase/carboxylesterase [Rhodospirillales bacterium]|nr:phospholipase/carboxylesterase [Rhodospirillales bacterium]
MTNTSASPLVGPSRPPANGTAPRQLVVFLHGYGADGADLIGLAPFFAQALPNAEFLAPNAPERCGMGFGYQWFGLTNLAPGPLAAGVRNAAPLLDAFLDDALKSRSLSYDQLALVGFSQGTMMALDRMMRRGDVAAMVGFSGKAVDSAATLPKEAKHPPVLLVHGDADPIVPFASLGEAEHALSTGGFPVETLVRPGLAHGIDQEGALRAAQFLMAHLPT